MLSERVVVVGGCVGHWAGLTGLFEVDLWMGGWEDGVRGPDHWADLGGHDWVWLSSRLLLFGEGSDVNGDVRV